MRDRFSPGLLCLALLAGACADQAPTRLSGDVVATFEGGEVTQEEFIRELLELPPERRPTGESLDESWLAEFVTELVVDRLLDRQADLTGFGGDPRVIAARAEFERTEVWNAFVRENLPQAVRPDEATLRSEFERRRDEMRAQSERRKVDHIFLRRQPGESHSSLRQRANDLRARLQGGESFAQVAQAHSDTESRDRGGNIGWVEKPQLEPAVAEIVFALDEGEISEVAVTREGAHLFTVSGIQRQVEAAFEDVRADLARTLMTTEQQEHVLNEARSLPEPETYFVASVDELVALAQANDPTALVLRHGDYEIRLAALVERAAGEASLAAALESLALREKVYAAAQRRGGALSPEAQRRTARATQRERLRLQRLDGMRLLLGRDEQRLRSYFRANQARFSTPLMVELERLTVPASSNEKALVLELGDRLRESNGRPDLGALAREIGGEVEALGWMSIAALGDQALAGAIAGLEPGQATLPRLVDASVEITLVRGRREPEARSLATALEEVRDAYLAEFGQPLYAEWRDDLLRKANAIVKAPQPSELLGVLAPRDPPAGQANFE